MSKVRFLFVEARGYRLVRYCDDFVIFAKFRRKAERALQVTRELLEGKLMLKLHPEKTKIVNSIYEGFEFLGWFIKFWYVCPRRKSVNSFKDKVRYITRRKQPRNLKMVIDRLNPVIRGWGNYFRNGNVKKLYRDVDGWIRMRLRSFLEKKKAVYNQNRRIYTSTFKAQGMIFLQDLLANPLLVRGQLRRKAVYGKSVRTV